MTQDDITASNLLLIDMASMRGLVGSDERSINNLIACFRDNRELESFLRFIIRHSDSNLRTE